MRSLGLPIKTKDPRDARESVLKSPTQTEHEIVSWNKIITKSATSKPPSRW